MASIASATLVSEASGDMRFPTGEVGDLAATLSQVQTLFTGSYSVVDNGLVNDGVTDNSAALTSLIALASAGDTLIFPNGSYAFSSIVNVTKRLNFVGYNATIENNFNGILFNVSVNGCTFKGLRFVGSGKDEGSTLQNPIKFDTCGVFLVTDCVFSTIAGFAIDFENNQTPGSLGGVISNCSMYDNNYAIRSSAFGEYVLITACNINENNFGVSLYGGNVTLSGCNVNYNNLGVEIVSSGNNAHGIFSGCNINHNVTYNLKLHDFTLGQTIVGCHFYEGDIWLKNSFSTIFESCTIDVVNIYFENSENTVFNNCSFDDAYASTVENNFNATTSTTNYFRCHHIDGRIATDPITFYVATQSDSVVVPAAEAFYLGDPSANDSWRIIRSGNNLVRQRREAGVWVTKATDTP